ncbi:MAG: NADH-quinone oxidoreductase subunit E, partial [Propionibacterium sp.]|nr:NADH-quinone oxidoreductase subunit E [Propionibacterium sp.]
PDGRADEGPSAGEASLRGVTVAKERGWSAPDPARISVPQQTEEGK